MQKNQGLYQSFVNAFRGLRFATMGSRNMKIMYAAGILAVGAGAYYHITRFEWAVIFVCIGCVIAVELLNTAIELVMDMIQPEFDVRVGKIKDIAAAAALIISLASLVVGVFIFYRHITA